MLRCVFVRAMIETTKNKIQPFVGCMFYKFGVNNGFAPREELVNKTAERLVESELERGKGFVEVYPLQKLPASCPESEQECAKLSKRLFVRKNKIVCFECLNWQETFIKEDFDTDESLAKVAAVKKRDEEVVS